MSGLSEAEREALEAAAIAVNGYFPDDLYAAVERITDARVSAVLAGVEALADGHRDHGRGFYAFCALCNTNEAEDRIRAAIAAARGEQ